MPLQSLESGCYLLDSAADVLFVASQLSIFQLLIDAYIIGFLLRLLGLKGIGFGFFHISLDFHQTFTA